MGDRFMILWWSPSHAYLMLFVTPLHVKSMEKSTGREKKWKIAVSAERNAKSTSVAVASWNILHLVSVSPYHLVPKSLDSPLVRPQTEQRGPQLERLPTLRLCTSHPKV